MRKTILIALLAGIAAIAGAPSEAGPRAGSVTVECWQNGVVVAQIQAGSDFVVKGEGFRPSMTHNVCITGDYCMPVESDATGALSQTRRLDSPGAYTLTIYQPRNRQLESWVARATMQIAVTN